MRRQMDVNSDMGESFGNRVMGNDAALLPLVTTANVACGFHARDPRRERDGSCGALREGGHAPLLTANHGTEVSAAIFPAVGPLGYARKKSR